MLLEAVPVPTVIPLPAYPPVADVTAAVIVFLETDEVTNPVSNEIPTGDEVLVVVTLIVFCDIVLLKVFPT